MFAREAVSGTAEATKAEFVQYQAYPYQTSDSEVNTVGTSDPQDYNQGESTTIYFTMPLIHEPMYGW